MRVKEAEEVSDGGFRVTIRGGESEYDVYFPPSFRHKERIDSKRFRAWGKNSLLNLAQFKKPRRVISDLKNQIESMLVGELPDIAFPEEV